MQTSAQWKICPMNSGAPGEKFTIKCDEKDKLIVEEDGTVKATKLKLGDGLNQDGNVGIGIETPTGKLDVTNDTAIRVGSAYLSSGSHGQYMHLSNAAWYVGSSNCWQFPEKDEGALLQFCGQTISFFKHTGKQHVRQITITPDGNVGIGNQNPGTNFKFQVQGGDTSLGGALTVTGAATLQGAVTVTGTTTLSSLKIGETTITERELGILKKLADGTLVINLYNYNTGKSGWYAQVPDNGMKRNEEPYVLATKNCDPAKGKWQLQNPE